MTPWPHSVMPFCDIILWYHFVTQWLHSVTSFHDNMTSFHDIIPWQFRPLPGWKVIHDPLPSYQFISWPFTNQTSPLTAQALSKVNRFFWTFWPFLTHHINYNKIITFQDIVPVLVNPILWLPSDCDQSDHNLTHICWLTMSSLLTHICWQTIFFVTNSYISSLSFLSSSFSCHIIMTILSLTGEVCCHSPKWKGLSGPFTLAD